MIQGYHNSFKNHARQMVQKPVYMPGLELAIDTGETLNPIRTNVILMPVNLSRRPAVESAKTDDAVAKMGLGQPVDISMFPQEFYLGEVIR